MVQGCGEAAHARLPGLFQDLAGFRLSDEAVRVVLLKISAARANETDIAAGLLTSPQMLG
jgi:hypothetical protein